MRRFDVVVLLGLLVGCSSGQQPVDPILTAGGAGQGGAGQGCAGQGGPRDGCAAQGDGSVTAPWCVAALMASCEMKTGTCATKPEDGSDVLWCKCPAFAFKVPPTTETSIRPAPGVCSRSVTKVYKADGSLCYTYEAETNEAQACEVTWPTWRDGSGRLVSYGTQCFPVADAGVEAGACP